MSKPKISIITVSFNAVLTIEKTILSVVSQTYSNIEYIIIDGSSIDGTIDVIKKYEDKISYWISEPDNGIYDAWNKGLKKATGEWICFLGADDQLVNNHTEIYVNYILDAKEELDYVMSNVDLVDKSGCFIRTIGKPYKWNAFKKRMCCLHTGSMHSIKYFDKYGKFDTKYKITGDYEILLRAKDNLKVGYIDKSTVKMQVGGISDSQNVHKENKKAKIHTAERNRYLVNIEEYWFQLKSFIRDLVH